MNTKLGALVAARSLANRIAGRPICVSFEVTHSCSADCLHCDKGRMKREDGRILPDDYARWSRELKPAVTQLSGGEPLTRHDLEDIARAVRRPSGLPLIVCITNGWALTEVRFASLREAGVNMFSVSLDFPDARHDSFRQLRGLFARLEKVVPRLAAIDRSNGIHGGIVLNTALTRANFREIPALVDKAESWGVRISFSAYSHLRTGERGFSITEPEDLRELERHFGFLRERRRRVGSVLNSDYVLDTTLDFFRERGRGGCQAGVRFLVVRPDGLLNPCSMHPDHRYRTREEAVRGFTVRDQCRDCYVSIRALTERPPLRSAADGLAVFSQLR
jgi:MoaA/NifB/PqqE/SkfB family radical SAM enzyme